MISLKNNHMYTTKTVLHLQRKGDKAELRYDWGPASSENLGYLPSNVDGSDSILHTNPRTILSGIVIFAKNFKANQYIIKFSSLQMALDWSGMW